MKNNKLQNSGFLPGDTVGDRLKFARRQSGITQERAARIMGLSRFTIIKFERGKARIREKRLNQLAALYEINISQVISDDELSVIRAEDARIRARNIAVGTAALHKYWDTRIRREIEQEAAVVPAVKPVSVSEETKAVARKIAEKRSFGKRDVAEFAMVCGKAEDEYVNFETGNADITVADFAAVCKKFRLNPAILLKEAFSRKWYTFNGNKPIDNMALIGACSVEGIEYELDGKSVNVFCDKKTYDDIRDKYHLSERFVY